MRIRGEVGDSAGATLRRVNVLDSNKDSQDRHKNFVGGNLEERVCL